MIIPGGPSLAEVVLAYINPQKMHVRGASWWSIDCSEEVLSTMYTFPLCNTREPSQAFSGLQSAYIKYFIFQVTLILSKILPCLARPTSNQTIDTNKQDLNKVITDSYKEPSADDHFLQHKEKSDRQWKKLSCALDRVFLLIFIILETALYIFCLQ